MNSYRDLRIWQQAMQLTVAVYSLTKTLPKDEMYGLVSQLRRAVVSIASNIAEGKGHHSDKEFLHFLYHARGSLYEVETQVSVAQQLKYISEEQEKELLRKTAKLAGGLAGLIHSLRGEAVSVGS